MSAHAQQVMSKAMNLIKPLRDAVNPQLGKDLIRWLEAKAILEKAEEKLKKMALGIHTLMGVQMFMAAVMGMSGDKVSVFAAMDSTDSDLRNTLNEAQGDVNGTMNGSGNAKKEMANLAKLVDGLLQFIKEETNLAPDARIIDKSDLANLKTSIENIISAFGPSWGNPKEMVAQAKSWVKAAKGGHTSQGYKTVEDSFRTFNQSVSALSTVTNTKLNFVIDEFKQYEGIEESIIKSLLTLTKTMVDRQQKSTS